MAGTAARDLLASLAAGPSLGRVVGAALSPSTLARAAALALGVPEHHPASSADALAVLAGLTESPRFGTAVLCLHAQDRARLVEGFDAFARRAPADGRGLAPLRAQYCGPSL